MEVWPLVLRDHRGVGPFRQVRDAVEGSAERLANDLAGEPFRQLIGRLDLRQTVQTLGRRDVVRMDHLGSAVEPLHRAGHPPRLADGQLLLQIDAAPTEEDEAELARLVMDHDAIRHVATSRRGRDVPVHAHLDRRDPPFRCVRDLRPCGAVNAAVRQVQQEIDHARGHARVGSSQQSIEHARELRPDARQRFERREDRIEEGRAHVTLAARFGAIIARGTRRLKPRFAVAHRTVLRQRRLHDRNDKNQRWSRRAAQAPALPLVAPRHP